MRSKLLKPPKWVRCVLPPVAFVALRFVLASKRTEGAPAYLIYGMSAYALVLLIADLPTLYRAARRKTLCALRRSTRIQKIASSDFGKQYLRDAGFRGSIRIYRGMTVNFLYTLYRISIGIRYASVWSISLAAYYLILGGLRALLVLNYRRRAAGGLPYEYRCYRRTALLLFLLNIPMGGAILLTVKTRSGFSYPGHAIYLSALYSFYALITSVIHLARRKAGDSPILSAAGVLNLVSALMSILGLQTALISRFSSKGEAFRRQMNALTGGCVYAAVIVIAVSMLIHSDRTRRKASRDEQIRKQIL